MLLRKSNVEEFLCATVSLPASVRLSKMPLKNAFKATTFCDKKRIAKQCTYKSNSKEDSHYFFSSFFFCKKKKLAILFKEIALVQRTKAGNKK